MGAGARGRRRCCAGVALLLLLLLQTASAAPPQGAPQGEILWDSFGIPHVFAKSEEGVFYGFGWAQAQSHGDRILKLYGQARGRAAEYWGPSFLDSDRWVVANRVPERAILWYRRQDPQFRRDLDAFARGINDYAARHPDAIAVPFKRVLPLSGVDIIAHAERLTDYIYVAGAGRVLGDPGAGTGGSNAWAIAPGKSADGHAMLLANPHLPWDVDFFTYYEAALKGPGIDLYGATQIGLPVLRFGFNDRIGFTNTVNEVAAATTYKLTLKDQGYLFDGKVLPFKTSRRMLLVRQPDGSLHAESLLLREAVQGPVFQRKDGTTVALKVAGLDRPGMLREYWDMGRARNFGAFEAALKRLQIPMFNIVYADRDGHILYQFNGIVPLHAQGDYAYWTGLVPGDRSATLWTAIHPYKDLPRVLDPPAGFLQNANDLPWTSTFPMVIAPGQYPPYMAPPAPPAANFFRAAQSAKLLMSLPKLGYEDFVRLKHDTHSLMAARLLPDLLRAAGTRPDLADSVALLKAWDGDFTAASRGALLFETWAVRFRGPALQGNANFAVPWSLADPLETPRGLRDPAAAAAMLADAAQEAKTRYGALDRPLGEVARFHLGDVDLPGNGGNGRIGVFRTINWGPLKGSERTPVHGDTYVFAIEFSRPMKAMGLLSYGNASQPGSPHHSDQLSLLAKKELRPLWRSRKDVEAHLESRDSY